MKVKSYGRSERLKEYHFCQKVPRLCPFVLVIHVLRVARLYSVYWEGSGRKQS
jgi:hypothetical protein